MGSTLSAESYFRLTKRIEMFDDLYEYFVLNRHLHLPGIGSFTLEKSSAEVDFATRSVNPPTYMVNFNQAATTPSKSFFNWLAEKTGISYSEAIVGFNAFAYDLKAEILAGTKIVWPRLAILSRGVGNDINVEIIGIGYSLQKPVSAQKVIREKAEHTIRVGEDQRTSTEMEELLHPNANQRTRWWIPALITAVVVIGALIFIYTTGAKGMGNNQKVIPAESPVIHKIID